MAAKYVSKSRVLYKRVFTSILVFAFCIMIYAVFFMNQKVTVSFNVNISDYANPPVMRVNKNEVFGVENFTAIDTYLHGNEKPGYFFDNWYVGEIPLTAATIFDADTTVNAEWISMQFQVQFDLNGGHYEGDLSTFATVVTFDGTYILPGASGFYKEVSGQDDLVLKQWKNIWTQTTYANGGEVALNNIDMFNTDTDPTAADDLIVGTITFQAEWKQPEVTVTFYKNDTEFETRSVVKGSTISSSDIPAFTSPTDDLVGWYLDSELTQEVNLTTYTFSQNMVLYPKWEVKLFTISFNSLGGSSVVSQLAEYGATIIQPDPPVLAGYRFVSWRKMYSNQPPVATTVDANNRPVYDFTYSSVYSFDSTVTGIFTLYAEWELQYNYNGNFTPAMYFNTTPDTAGTGLRITSINAGIRNATEIWLPLVITDGGVSKNVTEIGAGVFSDLNSLTKLYISPNITYIDPSAFGRLPKLEKFVVWNTNQHYTDIDGVLYTKDKTMLLRYPSGKSATSLVVGNELQLVDTINDYAFSYATKLTEITLNVSTINGGAFLGCTALTTLKLGADVSSIATGAFVGCTALTTFEINASNTNFVKDNFGLYTTGFETLLFYKLTNQTTYWQVPSATTTIAASAFHGITTLQEIDTNHVTTIGDYAFREATNLSVVNLTGYLTAIGNGAFMGCTALTTITIPESVTSFGSAYIFLGCTNLTTIRIKAGSAAETYLNQSAAYLTGVNIEFY